MPSVFVPLLWVHIYDFHSFLENVSFFHLFSHAAGGVNPLDFRQSVNTLVVGGPSADSLSRSIQVK
jgi:hypothetical protein